MDKRMFKKSPEELQAYLHFKRRGFSVQPKKGKGSYSRNRSINTPQQLNGESNGLLNRVVEVRVLSAVPQSIMGA